MRANKVCKTICRRQIKGQEIEKYATRTGNSKVNSSQIKQLRMLEIVISESGGKQIWSSDVSSHDSKHNNKAVKQDNEQHE